MYVVAREGETFEELFRRFKRGIEAAGILRDYRRKQRFKPAHEERRDKIRANGGPLAPKLPAILRSERALTWKTARSSHA